MPAGGDNDRFGVEGVQFAGGQLHSHHPRNLAVRNEHVYHLELIEEVDVRS